MFSSAQAAPKKRHVKRSEMLDLGASPGRDGEPRQRHARSFRLAIKLERRFVLATDTTARPRKGRPPHPRCAVGAYETGDLFKGNLPSHIVCCAACFPPRRLERRVISPIHPAAHRRSPWGRTSASGRCRRRPRLPERRTRSDPEAAWSGPFGQLIAVAETPAGVAVLTAG